MKRYYILIAFIFSIFINIGFIYGTTSGSDDEIQRTIQFLNDIREKVGVNELENHNQLKETAITHTKYMYYNDAFTSIEESNKLYYRDRYAADRAANNNYTKAYVYEMLNNTSETYIDAIINYINNPYSRTVILDPVYEDVGMGTFEGLYTFLFGGEKRDQDTQIIYPYNNQLNVPTTWQNSYYINPYSQVGLSSQDYGIPITYNYYSDNLRVDEFNIDTIELINLNTNNKVPYKLITPNDDKTLKNTLIILPLVKYSEDTTYELTLDLTINFTNYKTKEVNYKGKFSTSHSIIDKGLNEKLLTRAKATEETIKALDFSLLQPFFITFHDINIKSSSAKYIYTAYILGIVKGYDSNNTIFAPEWNITVEQTYAILIRAYEKALDQEIEYDNYVDIDDYSDISDWCIKDKYIHKAEAIGLLKKDENNKINPQSYITEKEFDELIESLNIILN